jgi:hypothetical protein
MDGNQSFCHCFTFHEKLDEYQILEDFDYEGPLMMLKKQRMMEKIRNQSGSSFKQK